MVDTAFKERSADDLFEYVLAILTKNFHVKVFQVNDSMKSGSNLVQRYLNDASTTPQREFSRESNF